MGFINEVTIAFMVIVALVVGFYDLYLFYRMKKYGDKTETISMMFTEFSWYSPMLPLIFGALMGHWFL